MIIDVHLRLIWFLVGWTRIMVPVTPAVTPTLITEYTVGPPWYQPIAVRKLSVRVIAHLVVTLSKTECIALPPNPRDRSDSVTAWSDGGQYVLNINSRLHRAL